MFRSNGGVSECSRNDSLVNSCSSINQIAPARLFEERTERKHFTYLRPPGVPKVETFVEEKMNLAASPPIYRAEEKEEKGVWMLIPTQYSLLQMEWWNHVKACCWILFNSTTVITVLFEHFKKDRPGPVRTTTRHAPFALQLEWSCRVGRLQWRAEVDSAAAPCPRYSPTTWGAARSTEIYVRRNHGCHGFHPSVWQPQTLLCREASWNKVAYTFVGGINSFSACSCAKAERSKKKKKKQKALTSLDVGLSWQRKTALCHHVFPGCRPGVSHQVRLSTAYLNACLTSRKPRSSFISFSTWDQMGSNVYITVISA